MIPEEIIKRAPSAGLWEGQTDENEIGMKYDILDEIIYRLDNKLDTSDMKIEEVEKVKKMIRLARHKQQMPPYFKIL